MTTRTLSGHYPSGYYLHGATTILSIASSGYVGGAGVYDTDPHTGAHDMTQVAVFNDGIVLGGVNLYLADNITNGSATDGSAFIGGGLLDNSAISPQGTPTVANFGTISGNSDSQAIWLIDGGVVVNGSAAHAFGTLDGNVTFGRPGGAGSGTLTNYAIVEGSLDVAVRFNDGGRVTNGGPTTTGAIITGATSGVVVLGAAGTVSNFGTITGRNGFGVQIQSGPGSVTNLGTITGLGAAGYGVELGGGGQIVNGSAQNTTARIMGGLDGVSEGGIGVLTNFGRIAGQGGSGVDLTAGGTLVNGSATDTKAAITGYAYGAALGNGTVRNFGVIAGGSEPTSGGVRINLGTIFNGSSNDSAAVIEGYRGIVADDTAAVINYGAVLGAGGTGVQLVGGALLNGVTGVIDGADGVASSLAATIYNYGAIQGVGGYGVRLTKGGKVRNGAVALIEGAGGVITTGAAVATIANLGEIRASSGYGVLLAGGGTVTNGSASDTRSSIRGQRGLGLAYGTGINYGAIEGYNGVGAAVGGYSILTNGSASDHAALIEGVTGVTLAGAGSSSTLINFGTVEGTGGTAVSLAGPEGRLVLEAGCAFEGAVIGNEGVLVLDAPGAVIALPTTTSIVVSGDMTAHAFSGFGQLDIDAKATASLSGSGTLLGTALEVQGSLSVAGTLRLGVDSVLVVASVAGSKGTLAGGGTLDVLNGGQALFNAGASLATAKVLMSGAASAVTVAPGVNLTYGGTWKQTAGTLTAGTGVFGTGSMTFTGSGNSFGGTLAGQIAITAGSDTFATTSVKGHVTISNTATVTFQGAITIGAANAISVSGGKVIIAATGAYLTGGTMPWATPA